MNHPKLNLSRRQANWAAALCLLAVSLLACGPFLGGGLWHGSDLGYHLRRIENIAMGLAAGQFPVRIQSDWINGFGYAVGVFYGDALLYLPALLRLAGVPVSAAYDLYLFGITLFTAAAGYYAGRRLGGGRCAALAGAALYTLAAYRLCDVTDRAALGEYTAIAFLPLVAAGFWRALWPDQARLPGWLLLVLGLSGVLQSHLLSFEMTALLLVLAALVFARRVFTRAVFARLAGAVGVFCALNAGFLLPLLDYYFTGKFAINQPGGVAPIQQNGAAPGQLLSLPYTLASGEQADLVQGMALTPGPALLLGALAAAGLAVYALASRRSRRPAAACLALVASGAGCLALSGNFFPWDALYALGGTAQRLVGSLQFPWRFLGPACLLLALAVGAGLQCAGPRLRAGVAAALCLAAAVAAAGQLHRFTATAAPESYTYGTEEPFWQMGCGHYLPAENGPTDLAALPTGPVWADGITLTSYEKTGTTITFTAANDSDVAAWVRLPLLWYRGYTARGADGQALAVTCGENNLVTVTLTPGQSGTFTVRFTEPLAWRAAELLTLLTALTLAGWAVCKARKNPGR